MTSHRLKLHKPVMILVVLALLIATPGVALRVRYPGFTTALYRQLAYSTAHENRNLWFCIRTSWLDFLQQLTFDPKTQLWSFDKTPAEGMSDFDRGQLAFHRGEFADAVMLFKNDVQAHGDSESRLFWLALSYMRLGEAENCRMQLQDGAAATSDPVQQQSMQKLCTLPLTEFHHHREPSREAERLFQVLLDKYDNANYLYRWLLNLSSMTVQDFPQGVPARYRIQGDFMDTFYGSKGKEMEARYGYLSFAEQARQMGITGFNTGRGVAVEDFSNSGFLDLVTCSMFEGIHFYRNQSGQRFVDQTRASGLQGIKQCFSVVPVDYDNDGAMDLFVSQPFSHYALLKNNGDGSFRDVTVETGLWNPKDDGKISATWIPVWADVNNDGKLDLFLAQWGLHLPFISGVLQKIGFNSALFINENGRFVNRTREYGLEPYVRDYYYVGAAFGDYNGDGFPDLLLASPLRKSTVLLRNVDGRYFVDSHLLRQANSGFTAGFLDVNHDGRLDIFIGGFSDATSTIEQTVFGLHKNEFLSGRSSLFIQQPDGSFQEQAHAFDMREGTMGASWGDLTNSGCYDFYFGSGGPEPWFVMPHLMYMGRPKGTGCSVDFDNVSMLQGFGNFQKGHGIVFFDFNNDGRQDVFSSLGGMWPGDSWVSQFFVNHSRLTNTWTKIRLRGRRSNRFGIGALIRVEAENGQHQSIVRTYYMDQKTGFGAGPYLAHIGMADAVRISKVEVTWPTTRCKASYDARLEALNVLDEDKCFANTAALR